MCEKTDTTNLFNFTKKSSYLENKSPIILFDGICVFCNYWVNLAIRKDRKKHLKFAALQSETASRLLKKYGLHTSRISSVILIEKGKAYTQSSAALRACRYLNGGWKFFYGLLIIPKFIRDFFYNIIARNRYRWFGKKDNCMIPTPDIRERFLE